MFFRPTDTTPGGGKGKEMDLGDNRDVSASHKGVQLLGRSNVSKSVTSLR